jgi:hypothetical protein
MQTKHKLSIKLNTKESCCIRENIYKSISNNFLTSIYIYIVNIYIYIYIYIHIYVYVCIGFI